MDIVRLLSLMLLQVTMAESVNNTIFTLYTTPRVNWQDAVTFCRDRGQELVRVTSPMEHMFLKSLGQLDNPWYNKITGETWSSLHDTNPSRTSGSGYVYHWQLLDPNDTLPLASGAWQKWYMYEPSNTDINFCVKLEWGNVNGYRWRTENCDAKLDKVICRVDQGICDTYHKNPQMTIWKSREVRLAAVSTVTTEQTCQQACTEEEDSTVGLSCYAAEWIVEQLCWLHMAGDPFPLTSLEPTPLRSLLVLYCDALGICDQNNYRIVEDRTIQPSSRVRTEHREATTEWDCVDACLAEETRNGVDCFAAELIYQKCVLHMARGPFVPADFMDSQSVLFLRFCFEDALIEENFGTETTSTHPTSTLQEGAASTVSPPQLPPTTEKSSTTTNATTTTATTTTEPLPTTLKAVESSVAIPSGFTWYPATTDWNGGDRTTTATAPAATTTEETPEPAAVTSTSTSSSTSTAPGLTASSGTDDDIPQQSTLPLERTTPTGRVAFRHNLCACSCSQKTLPHGIAEEQQKVLAQLKKTLTVDKKNITSYKRKLTSAPDQRTSAQTIGCLGMVVLILVFGVIVAMDASAVLCTRPHRVEPGERLSNRMGSLE